MPASRRRYVFHRGKLFVEDEENLLMVHAWPDPWARLRPHSGARWSTAVPGFPVVVPIRRPRRRASAQLELGFEIETLPTPAEKRRIALSRFRTRLPKRVACALERLRSYQWQHLVACSLSECFVERLEENPILTYLWIGSRKGLIEPRAVQRMAGTPQRKLLPQLDLPGSRSAVKFLRKCHPAALRPDLAEGVRDLLGDSERLTRLRHVTRVGAGVLALSGQPPLLAACAPSLLEEVATCRDELYRAPTAFRLENHLAMCAQLARVPGRPFRSRAELRRAHRVLVREYHLRQNEGSRRGSGHLGLPPLPGTQHIHPLTRTADLQQEGREQDNCVASYVERVHGGSHFIYRVTWPERCTLSIVKGADGRWRCGELEVAGNQPAARPTREMVDAWLRNGQRLLVE